MNLLEFLGKLGFCSYKHLNKSIKNLKVLLHLHISTSCILFKYFNLAKHHANYCGRSSGFTCLCAVCCTCFSRKIFLVGILAQRFKWTQMGLRYPNPNLAHTNIIIAKCFVKIEFSQSNKYRYFYLHILCCYSIIF